MEELFSQIAGGCQLDSGELKLCTFYIIIIITVMTSMALTNCVRATVVHQSDTKTLT